MDKILLRHVSFTYKEPGRASFGALQDISLDIREGEFVCLLGPSGCGKSTLLSLLMGLNHPDSGTLEIGGKPVKGPGIDRAVVFQHYSLFPWLTVKGNILFAIRQSERRSGSSRKAASADSAGLSREKQALTYLHQVGLDDSADKYPAELSGGMQQRVAIARALALRSDILLMDEPFAAVDPKLRRDLQIMIAELSRQEKKTVVFVTHDIDEAILLADRIVVMEPKHIREIVPVEMENRQDRTSSEYLQMHHRLISLFYSDVEKALDDIGNLDSETADKLRRAERDAKEAASTVEEGGGFI